MYKEAIAACQKALALAGDRRPYFLSTLTWAYSAAGRRDEALKVLEELKAESKRRDESAYFLARAYAGLGDKDQTMRSLEKVYAEEPSGWLVAISGPEFDILRDDPRFQSLRRRLNLPVKTPVPPGNHHR